MIVHIAILLFSSAGLVVTFMFVNKVRTEQQCGERGYCTIVSETQQGNFFRVKNTTVGFIYYSALVILEILYIANTGLPAIFAIYEQTAIWIGAGMSFYLFYQLAVVLHQRCPLCFAAQIINGLLMLCIVAGYNF